MMSGVGRGVGVHAPPLTEIATCLGTEASVSEGVRADMDSAAANTAIVAAATMYVSGDFAIWDGFTASVSPILQRQVRTTWERWRPARKAALGRVAPILAFPHEGLRVFDFRHSREGGNPA